MLLDVAYALITEGMDIEQREHFDRELAAKTSAGSSTGAEMAQRRAFALAQGQIG